MGITKAERALLAEAEQGGDPGRRYDLRELSTSRLERLYGTAWRRMTRGNGYQPYGYDWPTVRTTMPGYYALLSSILMEGCRQLHS